MQTEIDRFLTEQNALLSQQNSLLAEQNTALEQQLHSFSRILTGCSETQQQLEEQIRSLKTENRLQQSLISALKYELSRLEQGSWSEELQQAFQEHLQPQLQAQLVQLLQQLNIERFILSQMQIQLQPMQNTLAAQQEDLSKALLKISHWNAPDSFHEDLNRQSRQIETLSETVERLSALISSLDS